ncbi:MAG TPA: amino acid synthesis family protein [Xanthobacteraceae bacterium]|nr:amino acid synthesis family protein [Xanthobacteraceae bacterium]
MNIRRVLVIRDTVHHEGGLPALKPVSRVAACAVIDNPLAGRAQDDIGELVGIGEELGQLLADEALQALGGAAVVSYGKAAIVGTDGDIEHAAAILHPRMGRPMRGAIGGGKAIIPSNVKVAAPGTSIDVPLGDRDDVWRFDTIDTITIAVPDAPRPREIVVVVALSDSGRPRPRVDKNGFKSPGAMSGTAS